MIHCRSLASAMPSASAICGRAGSIESMASAFVAISAAINPTKAWKPMPWRGLAESEIIGHDGLRTGTRPAG